MKEPSASQWGVTVPAGCCRRLGRCLADRFEQHDRNLAVGLALITGVAFVDGSDFGPQLGAFGFVGDASRHLFGVVFGTNGDRRVVTVKVPSPSIA